MRPGPVGAGPPKLTWRLQLCWCAVAYCAASEEDWTLRACQCVISPAGSYAPTHASHPHPPPTLAVLLGHVSIYENITYGLEEGEFTEEDVYTASRQACAHEFITGFAGAFRSLLTSRER